MVLHVISFSTSALRLLHIDVSSINSKTHHDLEPMAVDDDVADVQLRRSERVRRPVIFYDYVVYLQKHDFDVGLSFAHVTFKEAISCSESLSWTHDI